MQNKSYVSPRAALCLIGLQQGLTWRQIGDRLKVTERTVGRLIADARIALRDIDDPANTIIEKSALLTRAYAAGIIDPNMRLSPNGYIAFTPSGVVTPGIPARMGI